MRVFATGNGARLNISFRSPFDLEESFPYLLWGIGAAIALALVIFTASIISTSRKEVVMPSIPKRHIEEERGDPLTGPLALQHNPRSPLALALEQSFVLLAQSLRPDEQEGEKKFCLGIRGSGENRIVEEGETLYFSCSERRSGGVDNLNFNAGEGDYILQAHAAGGGALVLKIDGAESDAFEVVLADGGGGGLPKRYPWNVWQLKQAKWWGNDAFFQEYGGAEYRQLSQKHRIVLEEGKNRRVLLVSANDFLTMKDGKWEVVSSLDKADKAAPLARVRSTGPSHLEIEAWDEQGFSMFQAKLPREQLPNAGLDPKKLFLSPKLRSARQFSCHMEKKRMVLKPGDWVVKTKTGWHKLKTKKEIEAFLAHEMRGDLVIIDQIDEKGVLKAKYFDEMRSKGFPLSLTLTPEKKPTKKKGTPS